MNKEDKKLYRLMTDKLNSKRTELETRREHFQVMVNSEINTGRFEQNAINDLLYMKELRTEIAELEHWTKLIEATTVQERIRAAN